MYWSPYSGDLLVAMVDLDMDAQGEVYVIRYNQAEQTTQTIQHGEKEWNGDPRYITKQQ